MAGDNIIKSQVRGHAVKSLSRGDVSFYAGVSASSEASEAAAMAKDSGEELRVVINMDATAEAAMGSREGIRDAEQIGTACRRSNETSDRDSRVSLVCQMAQQRCLCTEKDTLIGTQMRLKTINRITPGPKRPKVLAHGDEDIK